MTNLLRGEGMTEGTRVRLRTITQWLHLSVMAGLVGATILIRLGLFPYLDDHAGRVPAEVGPEIVDRWFSVFPWIGLGVFLTTGVFLFLFWLRDTGLTLGESLTTTYVKLLVVEVLLAHLALGIGVGLGLIRSMREDAEVWLTAVIGLVVVIMLISATLRRLPRPTPPTAASTS